MAGFLVSGRLEPLYIWVRYLGITATVMGCGLTNKNPREARVGESNMLTSGVMFCFSILAFCLVGWHSYVSIKKPGWLAPAVDYFLAYLSLIA